MITLAQLEQEVARRTGPFFQASQQSGTPTSSTATSAIMPALMSSALVGGPENLWLLRRGVLMAGGPTPQPVAVVDRQRVVQSFDPSAGRVTIDRNWQAPMQPDELADFTHLAPDQELHTAVMAGLRRCFFEQTFDTGASGLYSDLDLTGMAAWLVSPDQVLSVQYGYQRPEGQAPFNTYQQNGHLMLGGGWGGYSPTAVWVTALRPHWSWVNDVDSTTGPTDDDDLLSVDLDYAAAAGHIEAWHLYPARMMAAAAAGLQGTQEMAAREFTRQAMIWGPVAPRAIGFTSVIGSAASLRL